MENIKNSKKESEKIVKELSDEELMEITGGWYEYAGREYGVSYMMMYGINYRRSIGS